MRKHAHKHAALKYFSVALLLFVSAAILPAQKTDPSISVPLRFDRYYTLDQVYAALAALHNAYPALTYVLTLMPWGAYPGHEPWDIQSGAGKVNNFYHLRRPHKAVLRAPFGGPLAGGLSSPNAAPFGRKLAGYLSQPSLAGLVRLTSAALRG